MPTIKNLKISKIFNYIMLLAINASILFGFLLIISINNIDLPLLLNKIPVLNEENPSIINPNIDSEKIDFNTEDFNNTIVTMRQQGLYYYDALSELEKECFDLMYYGVKNQQEKIKFTNTISTKQFEKLVYILQFDCPTLFNIGLSYDYDVKQDDVTAFYPEYTMTKEDYEKKLIALEVIAETIIKEAEGKSQYEAEIYIHDYILEHTVYDLEAEDNDNIFGCLINGKASCKGYTSSFNYLLRKLGIKSTSIIGEISNSDGSTIGHSWNLIQIDNNYVYTDICWNDVAPSQEYDSIKSHYAFFNMTYSEMLNNRNISKQIKYLGEIPKSNCENWSYYKKEGLYANNYNEAKKIIEEKLPISLSSQDKYFVIQCKNKETYEKLVENATDIIKNLIEEKKILISSCKYSKIDSGFTLIIHDFL